MIVIPIIIMAITIGTIIGVKVKNKKDAIDNMNYSITSGDEYLEDSNPVRANEEYTEAKKIAEKYKIKEKVTSIDGKIKYTENINLGDEYLNDGKYDEAIEQYLKALEKSPKYDNRCKSYIEDKISFAQDCIRINEFMELGDTELENKNYSSAESNYKQAKELATKCNLTAERTAAQDKLKDVATALNAENDEKKAQEDAKKQKAEQSYNKGIEYMKNGDDAYIVGNYISAIKQYNLAKEQFTAAENESLVKEIDEKLEDIDKLIEAKKNEAAGYVNDARKLASENKIDEAKEKYRLAQDIYKNLELIDMFNIVESEIKSLG